MDAQLLLEENTVYAYMLRTIGRPTFDKVRQLVVDFVGKLSEEDKADLYRRLGNGRDMLGSEILLAYYLYSYGKMHLAKLNYAFDQLPPIFWENKVDIVAWGCGQGLEVMAYADYLQLNGLAANVTSITLVEPSELSLKRAALHARLFFPDAEVRTVCKYIEDLCKEDFPERQTSLHLFSNILDIEEIDLSQLTCLIKSIRQGGDYYVCVSPIYNSCGGGGVCEDTCRLSCFAKELDVGLLARKCIRDLEYGGTNPCTMNVQVLTCGAISAGLQELMYKANTGDMDAQYELGLTYDAGKEVTQNYILAAKWYKKAAMQGDKRAQSVLGVMYEYGRGVVADMNEAFRLYSLSAAQGDTWAMGNLADMYEFGKGVEKDMEEAIRLYKLSAADGYEFAQNALKRLEGEVAQ
ncbi:tetratricopeptide repeat protein [Parabacteroides chinchillae]